MTAALDEFDFMKAGRSLESYINDLSTWYLRRSRQRDDTTFFDSFRCRLNVLLRLMAPFMPFMTEYLYRELRTYLEPVSVHLTDWPLPVKADGTLLPLMRSVRQAVELGQSVRSDAKLKVRQPLAEAWILGLPTDDENIAELIADELNVLKVSLVKALPEGLPFKGDTTMAVALDNRLSDSLLLAGQARELTRQLQSLRKTAGLQPGEQVTLLAGPFARSFLEPLFIGFPETLTDSSISVDPSLTWTAAGESALPVNGETVYVSLRRG